MTRSLAPIAAALGGNDDALAALVQAYQGRLQRLGLATCRNPGDAADVVQEAFIKLARRGDVQRSQGVLAWLMTSVKRGCLRLLRRIRRGDAIAAQATALESAGAAGLQAHAASAEELLSRWELSRQVHAAIATLPPDRREVLILRDLEGWTAAETCAALGLSEVAMKSRLHRARTQFRTAIAHTLSDS